VHKVQYLYCTACTSTLQATEFWANAWNCQC